MKYAASIWNRGEYWIVSNWDNYGLFFKGTREECLNFVRDELGIPDEDVFDDDSIYESSPENCIRDQGRSL